MTYTVPATVSTGGTSTSAQFNAALGEDAAAIASSCSMSYINAPGVLLTASSTVKITAMTADWDSADTMLDLVNQRIVFKRAGTYRVLAGAGDSSGTPWTLFVRKNGSGTLMSNNALGLGLNWELDWAFAFSVNDYIELWYTNPGSAQLLYNDSPYLGEPNTFFVLRAEWVAP